MPAQKCGLRARTYCPRMAANEGRLSGARGGALTHSGSGSTPRILARPPPRQACSGNAELLQAIHSQIAQLPSYGYRRTCALVNHQHTAQGKPRVNAERVYRVMAENVLLIEAVEKHFGAVEGVPADHALEILTDNGCAYIAHETRNIARSLGLRPVNTPVCSLQSNGMAESFVNTFRRDYLARMDLGDAQSVLAQLPAAFKHFNEVHPHSCIDPLNSCTGVIVEGNDDEYPDGRRYQTLDGQA